MSILVTGATGFIGSWIVRILQRRKIPFIISDVAFNRSRLEMVVDDLDSLTFVKADLREEDVFDKIIRDYGIKRVIHLAALQIPQCRADPVLGGLVNVVGSLRIFEACRKNGVENIVYASSAAVYGPQSLYGPGPIQEDVKLRPITHYGAYKVCNELTAYAYWVEHNLPSIGLRPHTVYGFGRDVGVTSDITTALKAAVLKQPFKIRFGGKILLQYVADVAEAFVASALARPSGAKVYNLGGHVVDVAEVVQVINKLVPDSKGLITYSDTPLPVAYNLDATAFRK